MVKSTRINLLLLVYYHSVGVASTHTDNLIVVHVHLSWRKLPNCPGYSQLSKSPFSPRIQLSLMVHCQRMERPTSDFSDWIFVEKRQEQRNRRRLNVFAKSQLPVEPLSPNIQVSQVGECHGVSLATSNRGDEFVAEPHDLLRLNKFDGASMSKCTELSYSPRVDFAFFV